jgi:hypothetical protein
MSRPTKTPLMGALVLLTSAVLAAGWVPETTSSASATPGAPRVGFWAGQNVGLCGANDPTSCPRDTSNYTAAAWDALEQNNGFLAFDLVYTSDFGPTVAGVNRRTDAIPVVQEANRRGVPIDAWITVPLSKGLFANENNAATVQDAVKSFHYWARDNNLHFDQAVLDLEFPAGYQAISDALTTGDPSGLEAIMHANLDPSHQCEAAATYRDTITWAHQHGLKLSGTPILFAADDIKDGNTALQDGLDLTAFPPFGYDELYLQAYRAFGVDLGSGAVASYFDDMQHYFGVRGQVSLGNTGTPPYTSAQVVADDVRMLAAMGARKIPIFDFDSSAKTFGAAGIAQILDAANHPMSAGELAAARQMSATGTGAREMFRTLDDFATSATPFAAPWKNWAPQSPNAYPYGCGNLTAQP